jgi:hypothetical protein
MRRKIKETIMSVWTFLTFFTISSSFGPYPFIYINDKHIGRWVHRFGVSADSTMAHNSSHYLPVPDMHSYADSNRSSGHRLHHLREHVERQYEAFRRLHYVEPHDGEAWVLLSFVF